MPQFCPGSDSSITLRYLKTEHLCFSTHWHQYYSILILPSKIVELTAITDEMLKDADNEENVTKRFLAWASNDPMVAHNAKFDISFMKAACEKYSLGEFTYTVLDTMNIARMLYPSWPNHKLSTLVKKLEVPWDEDKHHRGDYDAEGTAIAFYKMCKTLYDLTYYY